MRRRRHLLALAGLAVALSASRACGAPPACDGDCLIRAAEAELSELGRPADRDEVHFAIAAALAHMRRIEEAVSAADRIENGVTREEALGEIAGAAARLGRHAWARDLAGGILDSRNRSSRVLALETVAVAQATAGDVDGAFATVGAITNPYRRSQAQAAIATAVARARGAPDGLRTATRIATDYWFTDDAHAQKVASGLVSRSAEFDHFWFHHAMADIGAMQARAGDVVGALQTARSIPDMTGRSDALARIAAVQAETGDLAGARETARRIEAPYGDLEAMVAIARRMAADGDDAAAAALARRLEAAYGDSTALAAVAVEQARRDGSAAGLETARSIATLQGRAFAYAGIAEALARGGRTDAALETLALLSDPADRVDALGTVTGILATRGEVRRALGAVERLAGRRDRDELVVAIALAQARAGDAAGAVATASGLEDAMFRAIALAGVARVTADRSSAD